jgi:hypothetical protein
VLEATGGRELREMLTLADRICAMLTGLIYRHS